eukprot:Phypoly_transcript_09021.p1 GENE.Phypoly_transcript_09021~~Phypoly_transcript_09021.p1  ORF type:complete len:475 (+),score=106.50 Phypoly_transcript_09021:51-1427(+)
MKQASISTFFKRSATATDDLLRPAKKKIKSDSTSPTPTPPKKVVAAIKEEDEDAPTPPIPQSPPSPKVKFSDDDGGDTEEDEELQEQVKSIARRSQSMPEHALKAAIRTNNTRGGNDTDEDGDLAHKQNGKSNFGKPTIPKVDKSRSRLVRQQDVGSQRLQIRQGDITEECTGAIVNAANSSLAHGGGVAGAISRKGGPQIQQESDKWVRKNGTVPSGKVALTGPGNLPCSHVIHAVGPVWAGGKRSEDKELYGAVWHSLLKAHQMDLPSIAIPAISSGIFGFPKDRCAYIMTECAVKFCAKYSESPLKEIRFTNFDRETVEIFTQEFQNRFDSGENGKSEKSEKSEKNEKVKKNEKSDKNNGNESDENTNQITKTTLSKNTTTQTNKTRTTTSNTSPNAKTKKATHNESGDETEEDESMTQGAEYESSGSEGEDKNRLADKDGDGSDSEVQWSKWRK